MSLFSQTPDFDFIGRRWYAVALSTAIILAGVVVVVIRGGLPFGIDFAGGTLLVLEFEQPTSENDVRDVLSAIEEKGVRQTGNSGRGIQIRLPESGPEVGTSLEAGAEEVISMLEGSGLGEFEVISRELVGPVIGAELSRRGLNAFGFAMAGILAYVAFRFQFSFGLGAIVAVAHDILVTLAMLTFFGYELSLNVVAAMLTITGYSVNDTIVVFDRVRENLRSMRRDQFEPLVNKSINQTLARTIITSGTTAFAVGALFIFGGEVLRGFAFTMLVGVISGTYSTIFIASSVAILVRQGRANRRHRQALTPEGAPQRAGRTQKPVVAQKSSRPQRSKRAGRKARAS